MTLRLAMTILPLAEREDGSDTWAMDLLPVPSSVALPASRPGAPTITARVIHLAAGHPLGDIGLEDFALVRGSHPYYTSHVANPGSQALSFHHNFFRLDSMPVLAIGDIIRIERQAFTAIRSSHMELENGIWRLGGPSTMPPTVFFELLPADYRRRPGFVTFNDLPNLLAAVDLAQTFVATGGYQGLRVRKGEVIEWGKYGGTQIWTYRPGDEPAGVYEPRTWPTDHAKRDFLSGFGGRRRI